MTALLAPDTLTATRALLREDLTLREVISNDIRRIDYEDRTSEHKQQSYATLFRAGGPLPPHLNYDNALITVQCFGTSLNLAKRLADAVIVALRSTHGFVFQDTKITRAVVLSYGDTTEDLEEYRYTVSASIEAKLA